MPDREKVKYDIERCICHVPDACRDCSHYKHGEYLDCMEELLKDALALLKDQDDLGAELTNAVELIHKKNERIEKLLKEQDERYKNMVLSWLREIAINNVECNREMTFLDAVEDIRDRASYGLKQYFIDKQEGR